MLWMVWHYWPAGMRFVFNFYKHWDQLLLHCPGHQPNILLSQEGVDLVDPLSMVICRISLVPLAEDIQAADPGIITPSYADSVEFRNSG